MNDDYAYLFEKYGRFSAATPARADQVERLHALFGPAYATFIAEAGFGLWDKGRIQLVDPQDYRGLTDIVFAGSARYAAADTDLLAYSAGGGCVFWNRRAAKDIVVDLPALSAYASSRSSGPDKAEDTLVAALMWFEHPAFDIFDPATGASAFRRVQKRLGPVEPGACYARVPAIALSGSGDPGGIIKAQALEHFSFLAQLGEIAYAETTSQGLQPMGVL